MKEWKLIVDKTPAKGPWNMAVDDYLFQSIEKEAQTYLRFYRWMSPTVSLGYSQKITEAVDVDYCLKNGIDIVRRITGGKLVLHHREVTYSICSSDKGTFTPKLIDSYRLISEALMRGLEIMGLRPCLSENSPPITYVRGSLPCFSYPAQNEIEVDGKKIIGSAQKRVGSRFIQHGSIPLEENDEVLESISLLEEVGESIRMISISTALGRKVGFNWAVNHLASGISDYFGVMLKQKSFNKEERQAISDIQKERYKNSDWTYRA